MALSFQVPVSALNNHQKRIEILSENIANLNTTGFKGKRMTFLETLGSISGYDQFEFEQGTISYTGNATDLAITGNSFFILDTGEDKVYTRAGAFEVNEKGELVNVDGYNVQGWMFNINGDGTQDTKASNITDMMIDPNLVMPASATENAWLGGNLNAGLESIAAVWSSGSAFTTKATLTSSGVTYPLTVVAGANDQFKIELENQLGESISEELTLTAGSYANATDLAAELNAQITANAELNGDVDVVVDSAGLIKFRSIDGLNNTKITLKNGTNTVLSDLGYTAGVNSTSGALADVTTDLNDLLQVTTDFAGGDSLELEGTLRDDTSVLGTYSYGATDTLQDIINELNVLYSGYSTATVEGGKITLTDNLSGDSETSVAITAAATNTGVMTVPTMIEAEEGSTGTVSTSVNVYDSLGNSHSLNIDFYKTDNSGEWNWEATTTEGETIMNGGSGKAYFDSNGNFISFTMNNGATSLTIDPGNGSDVMSINLYAGGEDGTSGLSQYSSVSTLQVTDQDGLKSGTLDSFNVDTDGSVIATFTNGEETILGQIAVAQFNNPSGLTKVGGSNFTTNEESGIAQIGKADNQDSEIESGSLEISTVDIADQFTQLIETQNAYQAAAKVINTFEEVTDQAANLKR